MFWLHWINALIDFKRVSFIIQSLLTIIYLIISLPLLLSLLCSTFGQIIVHSSELDANNYKFIQTSSILFARGCFRILVIHIWCWLSLHGSIWRQITSHLLICQLYSVIGTEMQIECASKHRSTQHKSELNRKNTEYGKSAQQKRQYLLKPKLDRAFDGVFD